MAISSIELVKILSINGINNGIRVWGTMPHIKEAKAWIVARTKPDVAGDTFRIIDFSNGTVQDLEVDGDSGFKTPLYFYRKKLDGTLEVVRIAGFGQCCATNYPTASTIYKFKDDDTYIKTINTHTDVGNPNNDNNIDKCLYIADKKKLLCGTGQGGRHIWIIDLNTLQWEQYGRIVDYLTVDHGYHVGVFSGNRRVYFIGGTHVTSSINSDNPLIVCSVELDDILENMKNDIGLNKLGTYEEIHKDGTRGMFDVPAGFSAFHGKTIIRSVDTNGNVKYTVIDFKNNTVQDLDIAPPNGAITGSYISRILGYWILIDSNGTIHILDDKLNEITTLTVPNWSNYQYNNQPTIGSWLNMLLVGYDNTNNVIDFYTFKVNNVIPKLIVDVNNKKLKVIDILTGNPIANAIVQISKSRAGNPIDEPIDTTPTSKTTDSNGEVDFSDIVEASKFISFQLIDI